MRTFLISFMLLACTAASQAQLPKPIIVGKKLNIGFNKNIEFLGFMYFITYEGSNIETKVLEIDGKLVAEKDWQAYGYAFYQKYKQHSTSKHALAAMGIAEHLWLSDIIPLLLQVDDFPNAKLTPAIEGRYYLSFSKDKSEKQAKENAEIFLSACNELYNEVDFNAYLNLSNKYYTDAICQLSSSVPSENFIISAEKFYRKTFDSYTLVPSLTIPKGMGFGPRLNGGKKTAVYSIFGSVGFQQLSADKKLDMGFGNVDKVREMGIHEFGHSFVNPELDADLLSRIKVTASLFQPLRKSMEAQGYNNWTTCLSEHFVRAGEILIAEKIGNNVSAERLRSEYITERKFIYLPIIIEELRRFSEDEKDTYQKVIDRVLLALEKKLAHTPEVKQVRSSSNEPKQAVLHTEDISLFWSIFDRNSPNLTAALLQSEYLDKGTIGLKAMIKGRIESGKNLAKVLKQQLAYYQRVRPYTLSIGEKKDRIYQCFDKLKFLYPKAAFPDVYFVIGANNSGGTIFEQGLIVGAERFGKADSAHRPALDIEELEELVAHELVHFQQNYPTDNSLLGQCIREGAADFIGELIAGSHTNKGIYQYAESNKHELWKEFNTKMLSRDWTGWLYYSKDAQRKDVGYWMGYQICKAYYDKMANKKTAVWDILNIENFSEFFQKSGYQGE